MSFLTGLFSGGAGQLIDSVGNVLDKVVTTKEEKMQLENEIKKADMQYQVEVKKLDVETRRLDLGDIDSARKRDAAVQTSAEASTLSKNVSPYLAIGTTVLTFALFYVLIFKPELCNNQNNAKDILIYILGVLSAILSQVYSFYFGSSQGSQAKSALIEKLQQEMPKTKKDL